MYVGGVERSVVFVAFLEHCIQSTVTHVLYFLKNEVYFCNSVYSGLEFLFQVFIYSPCQEGLFLAIV